MCAGGRKEVKKTEGFCDWKLVEVDVELKYNFWLVRVILACA